MLIEQKSTIALLPFFGFDYSQLSQSTHFIFLLVPYSGPEWIGLFNDSTFDIDSQEFSKLLSDIKVTNL